MEFTFDVTQTPVIGRRYLTRGLILPNYSAASSTVSSATSDNITDKEQVA